MASYSASDLRGGSKILIDGDPCAVEPDAADGKAQLQAVQRIEDQHEGDQRHHRQTGEDDGAAQKAHAL